jgi:hypothetical protein
MSISLTSKIVLSKAAFTSSVGGDLIIFDPDHGSYYGSGPVGARIWELIEKHALVADICASLMQEFNVDRETCEREVVVFLSELEKRGLVTVN